MGDQFLVNTYTTELQERPVVAADPDGTFVVTWSSDGSSGTDTDYASIQAQRYELPDIAGRVWFDADFDGVRDAGEPGLSDVTVHLFDSLASLVDSTTTDGDGDYVFQVMPDDYFLEFELPTAYSFTAQDHGGDDNNDSDVDPATGQTIDFASENGTAWDAGLTNGVGDRAWQDLDGDGVQDGGELGLAGVSITLFDADTATSVDGPVVTGSAGLYHFNDLDPGTYYLEFTAPAGYVFTGQNQGGDDTLDSDADPSSGTTAPFTFTNGDLLLEWDAGFEVDGDGDGIADRLDNCPSDANADQADDDSDGVGDTCDNCPADAYADQADTDGDGVGDVCDPAPTVPVGDRVWFDTEANGLQDGGENGVAGVTVNLYREPDPPFLTRAATLVDTAMTDTNGFYSFAPSPGTYYVEVVCEDGVFTSQNQGEDDQLDSDINPATGTTSPFALTEGAPDGTRDAGLLDSDSDGALCDDNCPADANADQADGDVDGVGDVCDNCPSDANADQADGDVDGVGDVCDNCAGDANADQADGDVDGVGDVCDNCPSDANADQADGDVDGVGDVCDNCPSDANADQGDGDVDGVGDVCDNCTADANADQGDVDVDGVGGVCDHCPSDANADQGDVDVGGVGDVCDHCPSDVNVCELCTGDDTTGDADGDGICTDRDCDDGDPLNGCAVFSDGFESGGTAMWSDVTP